MTKHTSLRIRILATAIAAFAAVGAISAGSAGAALDEFTIEQPCWWDDSCTGNPGGGNPGGGDPEDDPDDDPEVEVDSGVAQPVSSQPSFTG